jgi:hypothetical protein
MKIRSGKGFVYWLLNGIVIAGVIFGAVKCKGTIEKWRSHQESEKQAEIKRKEKLQELERKAREWDRKTLDAARKGRK